MSPVPGNSILSSMQLRSLDRNSFLIQLHYIALFFGIGQAGSVDAMGTALPSLRIHCIPYSVKERLSGLAMCAHLSIMVARAAFLRCKSKAFLVVSLVLPTYSGQ